jgi:hypothetical protein
MRVTGSLQSPEPALARTSYIVLGVRPGKPLLAAIFERIEVFYNHVRLRL